MAPNQYLTEPIFNQLQVYVFSLYHVDNLVKHQAYGRVIRWILLLSSGPALSHCLRALGNYLTKVFPSVFPGQLG
jgi:hypothetical protein